MAAALRAMCEQSTIRITGRSKSLAISAVEQASPAPARPSKRPMTPSTTATGGASPPSAATPRANTPTASSGGISQVSRLREGLLQMLVW